MYKFEITANSLSELETKIEDFVLSFDKYEIADQTKVDEILSASPVVEDDQDAADVVDAIQHSHSTTVPHLVPPPVIAAPPMEAIPRMDSVGNGSIGNGPVAINNSDELDGRGLPWDARIHSNGRSKNQDGTWRNKRGIDPSILEQVEKEISRITSAPSPSAPPIPPVPFSPAPAAMPTFAPPTPQAPVQQAPYVPPAPVAPPTPTPIAPMLSVPDQTQTSPTPAADMLNAAYKQVEYGQIAIPSEMKAAHTLQSFTNGLVPLLAQLIVEKKITQNWIEQLCAHFKVKNIWNVTGSGVQIRELYESFAQYNLITKLD